MNILVLLLVLQLNFLSFAEGDTGLSLKERLLNTRPQTLFLEVRKSSQAIPVYSSAQHQSSILTYIKPGQLVKRNLSIKNYVKRKQSLDQNGGHWHSIFIVGDGKRKRAFFYETYESFKTIRTAHNYINLEKSTGSSSQVYSLYKTEFHKEKADYQLMYYLSTSIDSKKKKWQAGEGFSPFFDYYYISQFNCLPVSELTENLELAESIIEELKLLPQKGFAYQDTITDEAYAKKSKKIVKNLKRNRIKKEVIPLSKLKNSDVIERENLDLSVDAGWKIAYEDIQLRQTSDIADISYTSSNLVLGGAAYVPLYLDLELALRGELSVPLNQEFRDNRKQTIEDVKSVLHYRLDQTLIFDSPNEGSTFGYFYGLGLSYKGLFSDKLNFAYDTLFGVHFSLTVNYKKYVYSMTVTPLGNSLEVKLDSRALEASLGYIIIDNEFSPDLLFYVRFNHLQLISKEDNSDLEIERFHAGISMGF